MPAPVSDFIKGGDIVEVYDEKKDDWQTAEVIGVGPGTSVHLHYLETSETGLSESRVVEKAAKDLVREWHPHALLQVGHRIDISIEGLWVQARVMAVEKDRVQVKLRDSDTIEWIHARKNQRIRPVGTKTRRDPSESFRPQPKRQKPSRDASSSSGVHVYPAGKVFDMYEMATDGNCLFRAMAHQVHGTPECHGLLRQFCMDYIVSERKFFEQFVTEPFDSYVARMRLDGEWADDVEIEALSEMYDCRVEIYGYGEKLMRTFHESCASDRRVPIRLAYCGRSHYNSLIDPHGSCLYDDQQLRPGELEKMAIARSRKRSARAKLEDLEALDKDMVEISIVESRREFEHRSDEEMECVLSASRAEWEGGELEKDLDRALEQSVLDAEAANLELAIKESVKDCIPDGSQPSQGGATSSSADIAYPESVYTVMSMGISLDYCIRAYELVGDNADDILSYCLQVLIE